MKVLNTAVCESYARIIAMIYMTGACHMKSRNCFPSPSPWCIPGMFDGVRGGNLVSSLCCVVFYFVLFVLVLRLVCSVLPESLDCPFLIATLVFSNV